LTRINYPVAFISAPTPTRRYPDTLSPLPRHRQPGGILGCPWIALKLGRFKLVDVCPAKVDRSSDIKSEIRGGEGKKITPGELEQTPRRVKPPAIGWMVRALKMLFQMDKSAGQLDEALEESVGMPRGLQPEVFEHVMRLIVFLLVKERKIAQIKWIVRDRRITSQGLDQGLNSFLFFHCSLELSRISGGSPLRTPGYKKAMSRAKQGAKLLPTV